MGQYFKLIDYPLIPDKFLSTKMLETSSKIYSGKTDLGEKMTYNTVDKTFSAIEYHVGYPDNPPLIRWAMNNLSKPPSATISDEQWKQFIKSRIKVRSQVGDPDLPAGFRVHADYNAVAALMYFWDVGGENVITSWWKQKSLIVPQQKSFRNDPYMLNEHREIVDYADLELIESVVAHSHQWYLYCGSVLHDVQNVTGTRKYVTIFFRSFDELIELGFDTFNLNR